MSSLNENGASPMTIRFAGREDCATILSFIKSLAKYERLENEVVSTAELLEEWLFDKRSAEVIFASVDGKEVGFALFFSSFSTFLGRAGLYLEDLFILQEFRGRGIGSAMLRKLAGIAVEREYGRMEWACLDWNTDGIEFYKSFGAEPKSDWTTFRLSGNTLREAAFGE